MKNDAIARLHAHPRGAMRPDWRRDERKHKFRTGECVSLIASAGQSHSRQVQEELEAGRFEITHLLPSEHAIFHYRIKDRMSGRERVVAEQQIAAFLP